MSKSYSKSYQRVLRRDPEKVRAEKARWYAKHKAEIAAKAAERLKNPEMAARKRARVAAWKAANPDLKKLHEQTRRARKAGVDGRLSADIEQRLFKSQRGLCVCCKRPLGTDYHLDHILPLALGGLNEDANMQLLRAECNAQKHAKHPIEFMQRRGYLL